MFEKSTHEDKMKKHDFKIICEETEYFSSEKKLFSCMFEKISDVRGTYFDVQILYANTLIV